MNKKEYTKFVKSKISEIRLSCYTEFYGWLEPYLKEKELELLKLLKLYKERKT